MNRALTFSSRCFKEIIRDPLSYIFCLGFPLVMLIVMTAINDSIPPQAEMTIFRIDNLAGGIAVFGLTFLMLFTCLTVSKDRSGAFLVRLYTTPMKSGDFIAGYLLPTALLGVIQIFITFTAAFITSMIKDVKMNVGGMLLGIVALLPTVILFISLGLMFGTLFNEKAAPGLCSVIISFASFLGGVWFDVDNVQGALADICGALPFLHSVKTARQVCALDFDGLAAHLIITSAYAAAVFALAIVIFRSKMKAD